VAGDLHFRRGLLALTETLAAVVAGLGKAAFGGGSVAGDGGGHRRTVEVRGSGARAQRRWRRRETVG